MNNRVKTRIFMVAREKEARRNIRGEARRKGKTNVKGKGEKAVEERENRGKIIKTQKRNRGEKEYEKIK